MKITFSHITTADIEALQSLSLRIWQQAFYAFLPEEAFPKLYEGMYNRGKLLLQIQDPAYHFYFILSGNERCGYLAHHEESTHLKLDKLYIDAEAGQRGIGSMAMEYTEKEARRMGYHKVELNVNRGNTAAIRFYQNRGFSITEAVDIPAPRGQVYNDYLMQKIL